MKPEPRHATLLKAAAAGVFVVVIAVLPARLRDGSFSAESSAMNALSTIAAAQSSYAAINGGFYDTMECLASMACLPGQAADRTKALDRELAAARDWHGYRLEFHAGPRAESRPGRQSSSSMTHFAIVATPAEHLTGRHRSFCIDDSQQMQVLDPGSVPRVEGGRCLDATKSIR